MPLLLLEPVADLSALRLFHAGNDANGYLPSLIPMRAPPGAAAFDDQPLLRILFLWFGEMPIDPGTAWLLQLTARIIENDGRHRYT
jgi:hypothetical protein